MAKEQKERKAQATHYFLRYKGGKIVPDPEKPGQTKEQDSPESVTFVVEGKQMLVAKGKAWPAPIESLLARRLLAKSKQWTSGAVVVLEPVAPADAPKAAEAPAPAAPVAPAAEPEKKGFFGGKK